MITAFRESDDEWPVEDRRVEMREIRMKRWMTVVFTLGTGWLVAAQSTGQVLAAAEGPSTAKTKVLHFPKDRSIGTVCIDRNPDPAKPDLTSLALSPQDPYTFWTTSQFVGMARGDVIVPAEKKVCLVVSTTGQMDLSCLSQLDPNDLYRLRIGSMVREAGADDRLLVPISHLTGLRVLGLGSWVLETPGQPAREWRSLMSCTPSRHWNSRMSYGSEMQVWPRCRTCLHWSTWTAIRGSQTRA